MELYLKRYGYNDIYINHNIINMKGFLEQTDIIFSEIKKNVNSINKND
jgi:hypothetical protein